MRLAARSSDVVAITFFVEQTVNAELVGDGAAPDSEGAKGEGLRGCVTTDNVYRPLMDDNQLDLFTKAAEELPQWVESLTREELMEAVPGSTADCLGGKWALNLNFCRDIAKK